MKLLIYQKENKYFERLILPGVDKSDMPLLALTNAFLGAMPQKQISQQQWNRDIDKYLLAFTLKFGSCQPETPIDLSMLLNKNIHNSVKFIIERFVIHFFITAFLEYGKKESYELKRRLPKERFTDFYFGESPINIGIDMLQWFKNNKKTDVESIFAYFHAIRHQRNRQVSFENTGIPDQELYFTQSGLLPLIWAELLFSMKNNIEVRQCLICGEWFGISTGKNEICSEICRNKYRNESNKKNKELSNLTVKIYRAKDKLEKSRLVMERDRLKKQMGLGSYPKNRKYHTIKEVSNKKKHKKYIS